jgi:hypothetical protein
MSQAGAYSEESNWGMTSDQTIKSNIAAAAKKSILKSKYMSKEKADTEQEMDRKESKAEIDYANPLLRGRSVLRHPNCQR